MTDTRTLSSMFMVYKSLYVIFFFQIVTRFVTLASTYPTLTCQVTYLLEVMNVFTVQNLFPQVL